MTERRIARQRLLVVLLAAIAMGGCGRAIAPLVDPGRSAVALSGGPNTSMIYLARTSEGIVAIDLGWWGARRPLAKALAELGARPEDVRHVFLTHGHRDHVGAWRTVRHARFHFAASEEGRLTGTSAHEGWIARWADRLKSPRLPRPGELAVSRFGGDTAIVVGRDTVHAFHVPGHTPGTAVYLFRGILFLGDAATWSRWSGFGPAKRGFSDDTRLAAASLRRLWERLPAGAVRHVCTAHAHCAPFDARFLADVAR